MLREVDTSEAGVVRSASRQIAVSGSSNAVLYTVPNEKRFRGYFSGDGSNSRLVVNGGSLACYVGSTGANSVPMPIELLGGSVCAASTGNVTLWGIEE